VVIQDKGTTHEGGGNVTHGEGASKRETCEEIGAVNEQKRKGKREKTHKVAVTLCHAFVSRRVCPREKR
jgi:hypothetical protein